MAVIIEKTAKWFKNSVLTLSPPPASEPRAGLSQPFPSIDTDIYRDCWCTHT